MKRLLLAALAGAVLVGLLAVAMLYFADLRVEGGGVEVPWVGNRSAVLAKKELEAIGLRVEVKDDGAGDQPVWGFGNAPWNSLTVRGQQPPAGERVEAGETVTLFAE